MRDDWETEEARPERSDAPEPGSGDDDLDALLSDYAQRKEDETKQLVGKALLLENARRKGAELLRRHVLIHARDVAARLRKAGHRVLYDELLESYPPNVRLHLYPKAGPLEPSESKRWTLELTWGEPHDDRLVAQCWTSSGLAEMTEVGSVRAAELDQLWVREQYLAFVRLALDLD